MPWNLDAALILALGALLALGWGRAASRPALLAAAAVLAAAMLSPLCGLAVGLFSARVAQHLLLLLVAAPLLALAFFPRLAPPACPAGGRWS